MRYTTKTIQVKLKLFDGKPAFDGLIDKASKAVPVLKAIFAELDADQEHLVMLALGNGNKLNGFKVICSGQQDSANLDLKILFRSALLLGAQSIIIAHNHPSGSPDPSPEDNEITKTVAKAGKLLGIDVVDHIIIAGTGYYAFSDHPGMPL